MGYYLKSRGRSRGPYCIIYSIVPVPTYRTHDKNEPVYFTIVYLLRLLKSTNSNVRTSMIQYIDYCSREDAEQF